jgi:hypothetical protein
MGLLKDHLPTPPGTFYSVNLLLVQIDVAQNHLHIV